MVVKRWSAGGSGFWGRLSTNTARRRNGAQRPACPLPPQLEDGRCGWGFSFPLLDTPLFDRLLFISIPFKPPFLCFTKTTHTHTNTHTLATIDYLALQYRGRVVLCGDAVKAKTPNNERTKNMNKLLKWRAWSVSQCYLDTYNHLTNLCRSNPH